MLAEPRHHRCAHAAKSDSLMAARERAFNVAVAGWLPCGLIFACAALTLGRDEDAMQARAFVLWPVSHVALVCPHSARCGVHLPAYTHAVQPGGSSCLMHPRARSGAFKGWTMFD